MLRNVCTSKHARNILPLSPPIRVVPVPASTPPTAPSASIIHLHPTYYNVSSSNRLVCYNNAIMPFAQLVIGPPGAGKSTYCNGMQQFLGAIGRKCSIVNLDPANDRTSYTAAIDVRDLVTLEEIMKDDELGPNGGVLYALEELEQNSEWLMDALKRLGEDYVLFDCPGQVELFTHHYSLRRLLAKIEKMGYRVRQQRVPVDVVTRLTSVSVDGGRQSHRLLLPHSSLSVHLDTPTVIANYAADGHDPCQRPH